MKLKFKKLTTAKDCLNQTTKMIKAGTELDVIGVTEENYEVVYNNEKVLISKQTVDKGTNVELILQERKIKEEEIKTKGEYVQSKFDFLEKKEKEIETKESFRDRRVMKLDEQTAHLKAKFFDLIITEMNLAIEEYRTTFEVDFEILLKDSKDVEKFVIIGYVKEVMSKKGYEVEETPSSLIFK